MDENTAFIQAIAAELACDTRRLVYADWLDEHHDSPAADFLRVELELARLPVDAYEAPSLRNRLWHAWAAVDPAWLMTFTQPQMLRANPTPFPSVWTNFGLGSLRECQGTYGTWPYESIPALPLDELHGTFQYLEPGRATPGLAAEGNLTRNRQQRERMLTAAAENGERLPEPFLRFMSDTALQQAINSVTDCFFTLPDEYSPVRPGPAGEGVHVHFYCDSQSCLLWDLYAHPGGGHCVIARRDDYFNPEPPDPEENEHPAYTGPRAWFVAPTFEVFLYRVWVENQVWYVEHADFLRRQGGVPPSVTPQIQAYVDHYRKTEGPE